MSLSANGVPQARLYGRRRTHGLTLLQLRCFQEYSPEAVQARIADVFEQKVFLGVYLEIGFGNGEHLLEQAMTHPRAAFIGAEPFENGFVQAHQRAACLPNLFLYKGDVRSLLPLLPSASLDGVYMLFPDPWPKRRHQKRRLMDSSFLEALTVLLKSGGEMRFATDQLEYAAEVIRLIEASPNWSWKAQEPRASYDSASQLCNGTAKTLKVFSEHAFSLARPLSWPITRYERKAWRCGRICCYLSAIYKT
jgi:tRNA (guanine-N7-)-methyltransferase